MTEPFTELSILGAWRHLETRHNWEVKETCNSASVMNLAVGDNWPGYLDGTTVFPQCMLVDYVQVYAPYNWPQPPKMRRRIPVGREQPGAEWIDNSTRPGQKMGGSTH